MTDITRTYFVEAQNIIPSDMLCNNLHCGCHGTTSSDSLF